MYKTPKFRVIAAPPMHMSTSDHITVHLSSVSACCCELGQPLQGNDLKYGKGCLDIIVVVRHSAADFLVVVQQSV